MSNLRDMIVAIDFDGIDIGRLTQMDSIINTLENNILNMGGSINDLESAANQLGNHGSNAMDELSNGAADAQDAIDELGNAADDAGDQIDDGLGGAEDATNEIENAADSAGGGFRRFGAIAVGAIAAIGTAAIGLGTVMGTMAMENEQAFDRLAAKTGATGDNLAGLESVAKGVFKNAFGENIDQVAGDVGTLSTMFRDLDDSGLQSLTEGAYTLSDLWGTEVKEVGTVVKNMTGNFKNLSEQDALDLLTTGFQKTGDYSDDLMDTMKEYSPLFNSLGLDAKESMGLLIKGAEAGAWNMDKVGDAVKEFGIRGMDGSKASAEGYKLIGLNANEMADKVAAGGDSAKNAFAATLAGLAAMKDPYKQNAAGVALFGTQWEDVRADVILSMQDSAAAVEGFEGSTKKAADTMQDNFGTKMTSHWRTLKGAINETFANEGGTALLDTIATKTGELIPLVEDLIGKGLDFADTIQENWPQIKETLITLGTAVLSFTAIMAGMSIIRTVTAATALWSAGNKIAALTMLGLNGAMLANPITWIVVGIASLIAIGVLLYRNWDTVKLAAAALWAAIKVAWSSITEATSAAWSAVKDYISNAMDGAANAAGNAWNFIKTSAADAVNSVIGKINDMINMINKIPGINIPVVAKVDWGETSKGPTSSGGAANKISGAQSHATGLESVPWDNYAANLHKDEAVLTAQQSNALRNAGILGNNGSKPTLDLGANKVEPRGSGGGTGTFAPTVQVTVQGGGDDQALGDRIAAASTKAIEKFWRQMALQ